MRTRDNEGTKGGQEEGLKEWESILWLGTGRINHWVVKRPLFIWPMSSKNLVWQIVWTYSENYIGFGLISGHSSQKPFWTILDDSGPFSGPLSEHRSGSHSGHDSGPFWAYPGLSRMTKTLYNRGLEAILDMFLVMSFWTILTLFWGPFWHVSGHVFGSNLGQQPW